MYCIKMTQEFGRGLYAERKIYANEIIEVAEILVLSKNDTTKVNETDLKWYTFVFEALTGQPDVIEIDNTDMLHRGACGTVKNCPKNALIIMDLD